MISIRIERLVLTGLAGEPSQLRDAVQAELARQLADAPPRGWRAARRRRVAVPELSAGPLAEAIARSIHRGIREVAG
ncbi:hypothetical protein CU254_04595 [Amycolatopsis sp. AA4]|uniref:hypothetical protein n=1 Tax=Actinomycetes TaxID=1760 RepID=UPI0001B57A0F|nr:MULTISPECIES: hypothetical protein [Actinomycetes]ATY09820.1 hypothetical protein CU254_04595 [Amycolatopsis sp. AA4]EFL05221.1 predicted protein [Streptomyces sp. AA4]